MLKRYFLIVTVLAGAGTILLTQLQVRSGLQRVVDERNQSVRERDWEKGQRLKAQQELRAKVTALAASEKSLLDAQAATAALQTKLDSEKQLSQTLQKGLEKIRAEKSATEYALADLRDKATQSAKLKAENEDLLAEMEFLYNVIFPLQPPEFPPSDLRATVVSVDPKWGFVVLDIGKAQNAGPRWNLLVVRNGKLVGKVQIATVQQDHSIANILPGWQFDEVREGDVVMPGIEVSSGLHQEKR